MTSGVAPGRLGLPRAVVVGLGALLVVSSACGSDGDDGGPGDAGSRTTDSDTDSTAEIVGDELIPEGGQGQPAPSVITSDGGYVCSGSEDVTIEGSGLQVGLASDCASVTIGGSDNEVDLWDALVVTVGGTNNDVGLVSGFFDTVVVEGDRNDVHMNAAESLMIYGTGHTVDIVQGYVPVTLRGSNHNLEVPDGPVGTPVDDQSVDSRIEGMYDESATVTPSIPAPSVPLPGVPAPPA